MRLFLLDRRLRDVHGTRDLTLTVSCFTHAMDSMTVLPAEDGGSGLLASCFWVTSMLEYSAALALFCPRVFWLYPA